MVFARILFPCSKLALKDAAQGTLLATACGLPADEDFDEDNLHAAMDSLTGHWCALEKKLATETFTAPVSLALYDLTSVYFEGSGPAQIGTPSHRQSQDQHQASFFEIFGTSAKLASQAMEWKQSNHRYFDSILQFRGAKSCKHRAPS